MKILQIIPDLGIAGAERMMETLSIGLLNYSSEVEVVSLYNYKTIITENLENHGIKVHYLNKKKGLDISMILKLYKLFLKEKPDVVHTHRHVDQYVMPAAIMARVPVRVHTVHNMAEKEAVAKRMQKIFFHCFDLIPIGISEIVKDSICRFYKLDAENVPVAYNGMDLSKYTKKTNYGVLDNNFKIIHIGRFSEQKNHFALINAFANVLSEFPDITLDLYGEGELAGEICNLIEELNLKESVKLCDIVDNINEIMHKYDLFVLPSNYEGMPVTIVEAMAVGMPIVAANVGGVPDMLENEVSALLCSSETDSIASCISRMYKDMALRERLGCAALDKSDKFSEKDMCTRYMKIYKKGIGE